uniref:Cytochrome P450 n=1 Tax=Picea sitchensis TaxID=3332 RepID=B8LQY0_PICSI|nr:unknown [Picea sitchensis]
MANVFYSERPIMEYAEFYNKFAFAFLLAFAASCGFLIRRRKRRLPPGPFPLPIIGNLHLLLGELPHQALAALSLKCGPLMSLRLGSSALTLVVSSADMAKEFLKNNDRLFAGRPQSMAAKYLSYNFSNVGYAPYGAYWRQMRKICVLQLLSSKRLESFRFIREEEVSTMIRSIISDSEGSLPVSISKAVSTLATSIICRMAFGRKYSDQQLIESIKESFLLAGTFNIGDYIPYLAWLDLQGLKRRFKKIHKTVDHFFDNVIEEHIARNDPNVTPDLVDVLLAICADKDTEFQIKRKHIKGVIADMFAAGTDTSSIGIEWAMSEVLRNPPVLKKLQDELERVVGMGRMVQESDLPSLVYLQAVVKEALRLHPPGPLAIPHLSVEDCTVLGYEIPGGTCVLLNLWAIGRNPKSWEDAESFKPERFMEATGSELDAKVQNLEWIPFGAGRRGCPGQQLGMLVVEFGMAQLLHCFNWKLPDEINGQELDMVERFNGLTLPRAHELLAVPTPRLSLR